MADELWFRPKTSDIPTEPGVYRWFDADGRVLYVGKAKNLRARLTSYFAPLNTLHERTRRMVTSASDVKWVIVNSEFEALQLEFTWIKEFNPPFNVQFRDDKSYPYLVVTMADEVPRALITRNRDIKGAKYFGPYTQAWAVRETLDVLLKVYPVRTCSSGIYQRAKREKRACLLGDIGKCAAPCIDRVSPPEHKAIAKQFVDFMGGADTEHVSTLRKRMLEASEAQNYELAARLRDNIAALETVLEKSVVVFNDQTDADLFGIADDELAAAVSLFIVRGGRIRGVRGWVVDKELDRDLPELVEYVLQNTYGETNQEGALPREVLVPVMPADDEALTEWLSKLRGSKVEIRVAQRGDKAALAKTAETNAKHALMLYKTKRSSDFVARADALSGIQDALGLPAAPLRIECFDVSHLGGTGVVASMVVFEDGLPKKDHYRRFSIENTTDDTESIYQVVSRRLKYLVTDDETKTADGTVSKFAYRPGLLIVDGGEPQVNAAARALRDSGVTDIAIAGLAKRLEEIWLPGEAYPVILPRNTNELFLLQRIRDEAHRFAITYQREKRSSAIASTLQDIPGLGEKRVRALLKHFGSAKRLRQATEGEISQVAGIGDVLAATIVESLKAE